MDFDAKEVDTIKTIGSLNDQDVKLVRMKGGLHIAVGHKSKNSKNAAMIGAASHPGILLHQLEKEFKTEFKPSMAKSEIEDMGSLKSLSSIIPQNYSDKGYDMFSLEKGGIIEYVVTKYNVDVANFSMFKNTEEIAKIDCKDKSMINDFSKWIAKALKNG